MHLAYILGFALGAIGANAWLIAALLHDMRANISRTGLTQQASSCDLTLCDQPVSFAPPKDQSPVRGNAARCVPDGLRRQTPPTPSVPLDQRSDLCAGSSRAPIEGVRAD